MTYQGKVRNGIIVLDNSHPLPEGAEVKVEMVVRTIEPNPLDDPLFRMAELAGDTGVPDLATNLDHYLYGHPKVTDE